MRALVTGAAGFIGSHLCEALLARGDLVVGVDSFTPYYDRARKESHLAEVRDHERFTLLEHDLRTAELAPMVDGIDVLFHLAAQPGVRLSWSEGFAEYDSANILATQRLLEACRGSSIRRLVFASSSSVYGNAPAYPTHEDDLPRPHSPYGVTKLAAEHLCNLYAANWGVPAVSLRYFTVYGPRQRPDMAMHRLLTAGLGGDPFPLFGDGSARREFTYVGDVVRANLLAAEADVPPGTVVNIAGLESVAMADVIALAGRLLGSPVPVEVRPAQAGDVARTGGSTERAAALLDWQPTVPLDEGLAAQLAWLRAHP